MFCSFDRQLFSGNVHAHRRAGLGSQWHSTQTSQRDTRFIGNPSAEEFMHMETLVHHDNQSECTMLVLGVALLVNGSCRSKPWLTLTITNTMPHVVLAGDPSSEHFMRIEALDYHDRPKFTMRWRSGRPGCNAYYFNKDLTCCRAVIVRLA